MKVRFCYALLLFTAESGIWALIMRFTTGLSAPAVNPVTSISRMQVVLRHYAKNFIYFPT